jgi:hypothetical protein
MATDESALSAKVVATIMIVNALSITGEDLQSFAKAFVTFQLPSPDAFKVSFSRSHFLDDQKKWSLAFDLQMATGMFEVQIFATWQIAKLRRDDKCSLSVLLFLL